MSQTIKTGAREVAASLAVTMALLVSCFLYLRNDIMVSQQPCEMTYMYAQYEPVDMPAELLISAGTRARSAGASSRSSNASGWHRGDSVAQQEVPAWGRDMTAAAARVAEVAAELAGDRHRLWRYTGESSHGPGRHPQPAAHKIVHEMKSVGCFALCNAAPACQPTRRGT